MTDEVLLKVADLSVAFGSREVVHNLSFAVRRGESVAIVGESGSGKSVTALSILGLLPASITKVTGRAEFQGQDLVGAPPERLRGVRGNRIGMIFQEPMTSLNPVVSIGRQLTEGLVAHRGLRPSEARDRAVAILARVGIADAGRRLKQYAHEFSGGMRQRVMIAMAMALEPALLIADEPTTALDVTIQAEILDLMRELIAETNTSLILITHDMGVVAEMADRVVVMRQGRIVETAGATALFENPQQPYTQALLAAVPRVDDQSNVPEDVSWAEGLIVEVTGATKTFGGTRQGMFRRRAEARALDDVSLTIRAGETLALVGESGSGKSTLGRAIARLVDIDQGSILVDGEDLAHLPPRALRRTRAKVQMIFQDPYASLDPRFEIGRTVAEPIIIHGHARGRQATERAVQLLERVGLDADMARRFPHEFSGGQRQRVAIARALAAGPKLIVADEPTSALDVSIQAQVLDLLGGLQREGSLSFLFISHDLAVVRHIAHRVAVMKAGRVLELGPASAVLSSPRHVYTKALLAAAPLPDPKTRGRLRIVLPLDYPVGPLAEVTTGHWVAS